MRKKVRRDTGAKKPVISEFQIDHRSQIIDKEKEKERERRKDTEREKG